MATEPTPTMIEWMFKPESPVAKALRSGVGGIILLAFGQSLIKQIRPTSFGTWLICIVFSLLLTVPAVRCNPPPKETTLRWLTLVIAVAYFFMSALYLLNWTGIFTLPTGYDAVTDLVSTLLFAAAWLILLLRERDKQSKDAEVAAFIVLGLLVVAAGISKFVIDTGPTGFEADRAAARLLLNICNGAIFLSLYGQIRRLFQSPDPVTHIIVLLYGCMQVAAHGRDCLITSKPCLFPSLEWIVAISIAWTLLLGKIAFGVYVLFLYFNGQLQQPEETAS